MEISSAVSGEDWISGREIDTGERWFRGALAPLDIVPGVAGAKKFVTLGRAGQLHHTVDLGKTIKPGSKLQLTIRETLDTAKLAGRRIMSLVT